MSQIIEIKVPDIGDYNDVPVIEVFVKVGDSVKVDDSLMKPEEREVLEDLLVTALSDARRKAVRRCTECNRHWNHCWLKPTGCSATSAFLFHLA